MTTRRFHERGPGQATRRQTVALLGATVLLLASAEATEHRVSIPDMKGSV
jgi:hypothetical protein